MNHQHLNIKFTFEVEKNNNLSFLDTKICRENNKFTTSVFRKHTFSDVFTNFDSFISISIYIPIPIYWRNAIPYGETETPFCTII